MDFIGTLRHFKCIVDFFMKKGYHKKKSFVEYYTGIFIIIEQGSSYSASCQCKV